MFLISFIRNNKISSFLIAVWIALISFGIISAAKPAWLIELSNPGRFSEAYDIKNEADILLKEKEYTRAIGLYLEALKRYPDYLAAISNLGTAYSRTQQYDKAIKTFDKLTKQDVKRKSVIYFNMAEIFEKTKKSRRAIMYYIKSAETAPFPASAYQKAGEILMNNRQFDKAIEAFNKGLENEQTIENTYKGMLKEELLKYNESSPDYEIINNLLEKETYDLSIYDSSIFEESIKKDHDIAKCYNNIGYCYAMKNEINKSLSYFKKSLTVWPNFKDAKNNIKAISQMK